MDFSCDVLPRSTCKLHDKANCLGQLSLNTLKFCAGEDQLDRSCEK
jgi:hypothetical protein